MKYLLILLLFSCSKTIEPTCVHCCLLSEKYTLDLKYIKTDTLWSDCLTNPADIEILKAIPVVQFVNCNTNNWEIWRYVI